MNIKTIVSVFLVGAIIITVTAYSAYVLATKDERLATDLSTVNKQKIEKDIEDEINKKLEVEEPNEEFETTYDTNLIFKYKYIDEGYEEVEEEPLNISMAGLTIDEVQSIYSDWSIKSHDENNIFLEKNIITKDGSKYTIGIKDGYVTVFKNTDGKMEIYMTTKKSVESLYANDLKLLNDGIKVYSDSELLKILEDFES